MQKKQKLKTKHLDQYDKNNLLAKHGVELMTSSISIPTACFSVRKMHCSLMNYV